jgi:hypothetical protein
MKPRIFIGSSSEGLSCAEHVKNLLEENAALDCTLWNDGTIFGLNSSYLESLLKAGSMFDFGILVATQDDLTNKRGEINYSARDNVLFEYGLFMGRLGRFRTLILKQKDVDLPSDLDGIHMSEFQRGENDEITDSLVKEIQIIKDHILERYKLPELGLLPSTSVAAGFYENFVERVVDFLREKATLEIDGVEYDSFEVQVVLPSKLQHDMQKSADYYFKIRNFKRHEFEAPGRGIRTRIASHPEEANKLIICDIPTTLTAVYDSIEMYLPQGHTESEFELIELREIHNFRTVLERKVNRDPFSKSIVQFIEYDF